MAKNKQLEYETRKSDVLKNLNNNGVSLGKEVTGNATLTNKLDGTKPTTSSNAEAKVNQINTGVSNHQQKQENSNSSAFSYGAYEKSDAVKQAEAMLQQQLNNKPGEYQSSWQSQLNDTLNQILNREKFSYDLNGDALYQQYKDQYMLQGQQAMMDTMGQAQAMTGGYGNSYAQQVGQQTYQGYLQQLNDKVPELYQLALDQYNREGQDLYNQYGLFADRENQDYGRYRDSVSDHYTELDRLSNEARYQAEQDYGKYMDAYNMAYGQHRDTVADSQWQKTFDEGIRQYEQNYEYQQGRDAVADDQWNQSFQYQQSRDAAEDDKWNKSFEYQQGRDQVADDQWNKTFDYQQDRDKTADEQWEKTFQYQQDRDDAEDAYRDMVFGYQQDRDAVADSQWDKNFQYQQDRDKADDEYRDKAFEYQQGRDKVSDDQWDKSFAYQQGRDTVADSQWDKTFNEGVRQFNAAQSSKQVVSPDESKKYKSLDVGSTAYNTILADIDGVETYDDLLAITKRYIALGYDPDEINELTAGKAKKLKPQTKPSSSGGGTSYGSSMRNGQYGTQAMIR